MPARYVIGQDGIIAYAEINPDYTLWLEPSDVFPILVCSRRTFLEPDVVRSNQDVVTGV